MEAAAARRRLGIVNRKGLHARASARFVETVERFDARATVSKDGMSVDGGSIMGLLMLAAAQGSEIEVETRGAEADALMEALAALLAARFGEDA
jgi:phosphocarrier protein